jgi:hypothetical protein
MTAALSAAALLLAAAIHGAASLDQVRVVRKGNDRLIGITTVDVLVTSAGGAAKECRTSRAALQAQAADAARNAGLAVTVSDKDTSWFYSVVVSTNTIPVRGGCATSVSTELVAQVQAMPEADRAGGPEAWGSLLIGPMRLLVENALVSGAAEAHDALVQQTVRGQVSAIARTVRSVNP